MTAPLAGIGAFGLNAIPVRRPLALGTFVTLPKANVKKVLEAGFVVRKLLEELLNGLGFRAHTPLYSTDTYVWQGDRPHIISGVTYSGAMRGYAGKGSATRVSAGSNFPFAAKARRAQNGSSLYGASPSA